MVDLSRYMKRIIEINPEQRWVKVEAGVIKDELNLFLKPMVSFLRQNCLPVIVRH